MVEWNGNVHTKKKFFYEIVDVNRCYCIAYITSAIIIAHSKIKSNQTYNLYEDSVWHDWYYLHTIRKIV